MDWIKLLQLLNVNLGITGREKRVIEESINVLGNMALNGYDQCKVKKVSWAPDENNPDFATITIRVKKT